MASEQTCVGKLGHSGLRVPWSPHLRVDNAMLLVPRPCSARFLLQKMNESWMCEEEPEALERSATAKVGMCCNVLLGSLCSLGQFGGGQRRSGALLPVLM